MYEIFTYFLNMVDNCQITWKRQVKTCNLIGNVCCFTYNFWHPSCQDFFQSIFETYSKIIKLQKIQQIYKKKLKQGRNCYFTEYFCHPRPGIFCSGVNPLNKKHHMGLHLSLTITCNADMIACYSACLWFSLTFILVLSSRLFHLAVAGGQRYLNVSHSYTHRQKVAQASHMADLMQEGTWNASLWLAAFFSASLLICRDWPVITKRCKRQRETWANGQRKREMNS